MSYLMVHLQIGKHILAACPQIADRQAFLIGTLAPDAIMFRSGCVRSDKLMTHFCPEGTEWGHVTDGAAWAQSLANGIQAYAAVANPDFLLGCQAHILTDIANMERFGTIGELGRIPEQLEAVLQDFAEIDSRIMADLGGETGLWPQLTATPACALGDLITIADVAKILQTIKQDMYANRLPDPAYRFIRITYEDVCGFMQETAAHIIRLLGKR